MASGSEVPSVGLGLWKIDGAVVGDVIETAIDCGYRHLDAACDYGNEVESGEGIAKAIAKGAVTRDDLWITSKLWNTYHAPEHVRPAIEKTLLDLKLDHLDLYLVHFPISQQFVPFEKRYPPGWFHDPDAESPKMVAGNVPLIETWQAMEEVAKAGLTREIGVSNYSTVLLRDMLNQTSTVPAMLQVELHPYLTQEKLIRFCKEAGIGVTGFSPLGAQSYFALNMAEASESLLNHELIGDIASSVGKTAAQVLLRWGVQRGTSIVPKTTSRERLIENLSIFDFELAQEQMDQISALNRHRRFNDPGDFCEAAFNTFFPIYD